jgi:hypothetical protein
MGQTGVMFFGLLVGFIVFITIKGELTAYLGVIFSQSPTAQGTGQSGTGGTPGAGTPCTPGTAGCGANGQYGGPGVTPPPVIIGPGAKS